MSIVLRRTLAIASLTVLSHLALSSASSAEGQEKADSPPSDTVDEPLSEIIVTARKRAERLADVPAAITVIGSAEIDERGLLSAEDYLRGVPGVNQTSYGTSLGLITIRGIETGSGNFGNGPATSTYFGETPTTGTEGLVSFAGIDIKLVDVERVEILRGPQGTAFGSSSMGGTVRVIPAAPKLNEMTALLGASLSSTSGEGSRNHMFQGMANLPLGEAVAVRAVGYTFSDEGFYTNVAGSDPAFQARFAASGANARARDRRHEGGYQSTGGRIAVLIQPDDQLRVTLTYLNQENETRGLPTATHVYTPELNGSYNQVMLGITPDHAARTSPSGGFLFDVDILNGLVEYDLGWADLLATYSHTEGSGVTAFSRGSFFETANPGEEFADGSHIENVGELRLASKFEGSLNFLAGIYTERTKDHALYEYRWLGDVTLHAANPGSDMQGDYLDRRSLRQSAAFGELSWKAMPRLTLTGGARVYDYERTGRTDTSGYFFGTTSTLDRGDASGSNFRLNASYEIGDNGLVYAGWSQGFRLGKPQPGLPAGLCDTNGDGVIDDTNTPIAKTRLIDSDQIDNYEIGGRYSLAGGRFFVDATVFRMDWSDMPVGISATCGSEDLYYLVNAGEAKSEGVELQTTLRPVSDLSVSLGGSYVRSRITKDAPADGIVSGQRLPGSPEWNANVAIEYGFGVWGARRASVRVDGIYIGEFNGNLFSRPETEIDDYVKFDATARLMMDKRLDVDLFIDNLTNEDAFTYRGSGMATGFDYGYRLRPRTVGIRVSYRL